MSHLLMPPPDPPPYSPPRLFDQVRAAIHTRHHSRRTAEASTRWVVSFVRFHGTRHPRQLGAEEIRDFLSHPAVRGRVVASTQNQALAALLFLHRHMLDIKFPRQLESVLQELLSRSRAG